MPTFLNTSRNTNFTNGAEKDLSTKYEPESFRLFLKENLSKKRFVHSLNVADMARELAGIYGADAEKAYFAGLVHDIAKEMPRSAQSSLASRCKLNVSPIELGSPPLLHAIAGAQLLIERFGIDDEEVLLAVRYHTVAAGGMSKLAQIIYLADLTSADRDYKDVKKMRKYARSSLEKGMFEALRFALSDNAAKGSTIPVCTVEAYNEYAAKVKASNG